MVKDAHEIVTELMAGKLRNHSAEKQAESCLKCEQAKIMDCECVIKEDKKRAEVSPEERLYKI